MFNCEVSPGAAHAGHDFVGNQQQAMTPANLRDGRQVSWRRRDRSQSGTAHGLKDEGRNVTLRVRALRCFNRVFQHGGILLSAAVATVSAVEGAAIAIWNADVL